MTTESQGTSVRRQVVVEAPIERAFAVFTEDFGSFKPPELYDRGADGRESRWARVLVYEPPNRVVFSWDISPQWQLETDLEKTSEVEVRFIAESPERTRVELEHRNLERHGEGWDGLRGAIDSEGGWPLYLQRFAEVIAA